MNLNDATKTAAAETEYWLQINKTPDILMTPDANKLTRRNELYPRS